MHRQISSGVGLGIIIILTLIVVFLFFANSNEVVEMLERVKFSEQKQKEALDQVEDEQWIYNGEDEGCQGEIEDFGNIDNSSKIVYETVCVIQESSPSQKGKYVHRVYIRGLSDEFNKKIFETKEDLISMTIIDENIISIKTSNSYGENEQHYYFNLSGQVIEYAQEAKQKQNEYSQRRISPNEQYQATLPAHEPEEDDYKPKSEAIVDVYNFDTKKSSQFDFKDQVSEWNGIYIDSWSPDSRYVYVSGGIYEIGGPAKLWRIDVDNENVDEYQLTDEDMYPVYVYPEHDVAFVIRNESCEKEINYKNAKQISVLDEASKSELRRCQFGLYKIDLNSEEITLITSQEAIAISRGFENLIFTGTELFYEIIDDFEVKINDRGHKMVEDKNKIGRVDILNKRTITYSDSKSYIRHYFAGENILFFEKDKELFQVDLDIQEKKQLGKSVRGDYLKEGLEYIKNIYSIEAL